MNRFFLFCSGAHTAGLHPAQRAAYAGIGATVVLTALAAGVSGGYAARLAIGPAAGAAFGVFWMAMAFVLDRAIVSGLPGRPGRRPTVLWVLPRLAIAALLALAIAQPLELKLFQREIDAELARTQLGQEARLATLIEARDRPRLDALRAENVRLEREVEERRAAVAARWGEWAGERDGTVGTGLRGEGPVSMEKHRRLDEARRQLDEAQARIRPLIDRNTAEIERILALQRRALAQADRMEGAVGLLGRLEAYQRLQASNPTVYAAGWLIVLLFLALQTAPLAMMIAAPPAPLPEPQGVAVT